MKNWKTIGIILLVLLLIIALVVYIIKNRAKAGEGKISPTLRAKLENSTDEDGVINLDNFSQSEIEEMQQSGVLPDVVAGQGKGESIMIKPNLTVMPGIGKNGTRMPAPTPAAISKMPVATSIVNRSERERLSGMTVAPTRNSYEG